MSGGIFEYLCYKDALDLVHCEDLLQRMAAELQELGHEKAAQDTRDIYLGLNETVTQLDKKLGLIRDVWRAVEWKVSGDCGVDDVAKAVGKYNQARNPTIPLSEPEGFTVHDFHREVMERQIRLQQAIHRARKERNHSSHRNAAARLDEVKRTEKTLRLLSPGCDQCVDGLVTTRAMSQAEDKIKLTVISYKCTYCEKGIEENESKD